MQVEPGRNSAVGPFGGCNALDAFTQRHDYTILDNAIKNKVVLCSPITLFAVLAVIRQAVGNFALEQTSNEILSLLGAFKKQWGASGLEMPRRSTKRLQPPGSDNLKGR
ncbi:MAG: DNA recombination protein RmuC [Desulfobacteraceae bacterium]|nr:DNA recombination protein RmuC [Desulfobacteraceae bacterium]